MLDLASVVTVVRAVDMHCVRMLVAEMLRVTELVVRVVRVAGVAVAGRDESGVVWCCRGSHWRTDIGLCGGTGRGALASNRLGCVRKPIFS
jgi:hypothetical protein